MSETKLCPFRKQHEMSGTLPIKMFVEEFAPCLQEKCAMWRMPSPGFCGLAGNPIANYPTILSGDDETMDWKPGKQ